MIRMNERINQMHQSWIHASSYLRSRFASFFPFLAAALAGFALALLSFLIFFFSPAVSFVFFTSLVFSFALGMIDRGGGVNRVRWWIYDFDTAVGCSR